MEMRLLCCYNVRIDSGTEKQFESDGRSVEKDGDEKEETSDWD